MISECIATRWYQNIDRVYDTYELTATYDPEKYRRYDNFDAINVESMKEIPKDYDGVMGVPIRFVAYLGDEWEPLAFTSRNSSMRLKRYTPQDAENYNILNGAAVLVEDGKYVPKYTRLLIRRKR